MLEVSWRKIPPLLVGRGITLLCFFFHFKNPNTNKLSWSKIPLLVVGWMRGEKVKVKFQFPTDKWMPKRLFFNRFPFVFCAFYTRFLEGQGWKLTRDSIYV